MRKKLNCDVTPSQHVGTVRSQTATN